MRGAPVDGSPFTVYVAPAEADAPTCTVELTGGLAAGEAIEGEPCGARVVSMDVFGNRRTAGGDEFTARLVCWYGAAGDDDAHAEEAELPVVELPGGEYELAFYAPPALRAVRARDAHAEHGGGRHAGAGGASGEAGAADAAGAPDRDGVSAGLSLCEVHLTLRGEPVADSPFELRVMRPAEFARQAAVSMEPEAAVVAMASSCEGARAGGDGGDDDDDEASTARALARAAVDEVLAEAEAALASAASAGNSSSTGHACAPSSEHDGGHAWAGEGDEEPTVGMAASGAEPTAAATTATRLAQGGVAPAATDAPAPPAQGAPAHANAGDDARERPSPPATAPDVPPGTPEAARPRGASPEVRAAVAVESTAVADDSHSDDWTDDWAHAPTQR